MNNLNNIYLAVIKHNLPYFPEGDEIYICDTLKEANNILEVSYNADIKELAEYINSDKEKTYLNKYDNILEGRITLKRGTWYDYIIVRPDNKETILNKINC